MEIRKINLNENAEWLQQLDSEYSSNLQLLQHDVISRLANEFENIFIKGISLKGFSFENRNDLELFLKTRVTCIDNVQHKERVYSIDGKPFFLHKYEVIYEPMAITDNSTTMTANYGSYAYL